MKENDLRFAKLLLLVNAAVPVTLLGWDAWHHQLGANPVNFAMLVDAKDDSALAFYERLGFKRLASRPKSLFLNVETAMKLAGL